MPKDEDSYHISRRRLLEAAGVGGAATLAGCSGGDNTGSDGNSGGNDTTEDGSGTTETTAGTQVVNTYFDTASTNTVSKRQFNPYNPNSYAGNAGQAMFERLAAYNLEKQAFELSLLKDYSIKETEMTLTLKQGWKWHNGDAVNADDLIRKFKVDKMVGDPMWDVVDSVEKAGSHTVKLVLSGKTNPKILEFDILQKRLNTPKDPFQGFVDDYENAGSEDERKNVKSKLLQHKISEPVGTGPFKYANQNSQRIRYERVKDHPYAKNINFKGYDIRYISGNQQFWQSFISDQIDGQTTVFTPPNVVKKIPDHWVEAKIPGNWGLALAFDHKDDVFGKREVRQAIAHVLNRTGVQTNSGPQSKEPIKIPCGMVNSAIPEYLGDAKSDFEPYAYDSSSIDKAKAESLLKSVNYSRNSDDKWTDENGEVVDVPIKAPAGWSDWVTGVQTAVKQLQNFGFNASLVTTQSSTWYSEVPMGGNYRVTASWWTPGGAMSQYPYYPLHDLLKNTSMNNSSNYAPDGKVTVPKRTGSGTTTINVHERMTELAKTTDDAKAREIIVELAWVANVDLPKLPIQTKYDQSWTNRAGNGDGNGWEVPDSDSPKHQMHWPQFWLPRQGDLRAKQP